MPYVLGFSGSGGPASGHAAEGDAVDASGFAPALCGRGLGVLVDHWGTGTPVLAVAHSDAERYPVSASVGCNRCRTKLDKLNAEHV